MYSSRKERMAHIGRSFAIPLFIAAVFLTGCEKGTAVPPLDDEITIQAFFLPDYDQTEDLSEFTSLPVFRINDGSIEYSEQRASLLAEYFSIDLSGMSRSEQYSGDIGDYIYTDVFTTDSVRYEEHFDHSIVNLCADPFGIHFGVYDNKYDNADPMGVFGFEHIDGSYFSYDEENDAAILPPERLSELEMLSEKYIAGNKEWFGDGYSLYCSRTGASTGIHPEIHNRITYNISVYFSTDEPETAAERLVYYSGFAERIRLGYTYASDIDEETIAVDYTRGDNLTQVGICDIIPYSEAVKQFEENDNVHIFGAFDSSVYNFSGDKDICPVYVMDTADNIRPVWVCMYRKNHGFSDGVQWIDAINYS